MTRVLLTVDTELGWRHAQAGCEWEQNYARSVEPAGVGLAYQLKMLARHGLKACFFVDPMPACRYGLEPVRRMVETVLDAGQEVQLHIHPAWAGDDPVFELTGLSEGEQLDLIGRAGDLLVEAGAPPPIAFRAGSYAADDTTLRVLAGLGLRYDTSFNASHGPWPSAISLPPRTTAPTQHCGIVEFPVTHVEEPGGALRHLQLCAVSFAEMERALLDAQASGQAAVTLVSHSFELATRDGLRANSLVRRRFDRLCEWLAAARERLPTAHFADLPEDIGGADAPLPRSGGWRRFGRLAEQAVGNLVYERRL